LSILGEVLDEEESVKVGGSRPGKAPNVDRKYEKSHQLINIMIIF